MILEYHRPDTLKKALELLSRSKPATVPLGGGSVLNAPSEEEVAVVDLQDLNLAKLAKKGNTLRIGATLILQNLLESPHIPEALVKAIRHEASYNLRQVATAAGSLVAADGRSPFGTAMLALDSQLTLVPGEEQISLGDLFPLRREKLRGRLITEVTAPLKPKLSYEYVARSPADLPIVCLAVARWPSGRTRIALGGFGDAPVVALDGPEADGAQEAVKNACSQATDPWATAEYRTRATEVLIRRCLEAVGAA